MRGSWGRRHAGDEPAENAAGWLPARTCEEVSRELLMRSRVLLWKSQRLRAKSARLLARIRERRPQITAFVQEMHWREKAYRHMHPRGRGARST
jgi:hypothetical protein